MEISKAAAGVLAAALLTTGAGAAWLMTRDGSPDLTPAAEAKVSPDPAAADSLAPVEQSEAIVSEPQPSPAPARPAAAVRPRRTETSARAAARPAPVREPAPPRQEPAYVPPAEPAVSAEAHLSAPALDPAPAPEPVPPAPVPQYEELIVSADSVIGLQVESSLTSEQARVEDEVRARVTRDVKVGDRVAIPAGAEAVGEVTVVDRGGKMRNRARLGVRFTSIVLADGTRIPVETDTIIREGSSPGNESAAKIGGGAIGGAIIGGILGGAKGAIIGGSAGAGAGTAAVMAGGRNAATLNAGAPITVRLLAPATVTVEK
jgi:type IV secretory pathway VirB10-like protein